MKSEQKKQFYDLLNALCEDVISDSQLTQLEEWLRSDREARDIYVEFMEIWTDLNYFQVSLYSQDGPNQLSTGQDYAVSGSLTDSAIWAALSRAEKESPVLNIPQKDGKPKREIIQKVERIKTPHHISKFSVFSLVVSVAAILMLVLFIKVVPPHSGFEVATVTDMITPEFIDNSGYFEKGSRLSIVDGPIALSNGFMMLQFDSHVTVTIEAPAEFTIIARDQIRMKQGRLYAVVPPEAIGFEVVTPGLKVIDMGTEFGVQVDDHTGSAELHVIKGKTILIAPEDQKKRNFTMYSGTAKKVQTTGVTAQISDVECDEYRFARHINSTRRNSVWRGQTTIGINCGGGPAYTSPDGTVYMQDAYYHTKSQDPQLNAANREIVAPDGILYMTNRYAREFTYDVPVADGDYEVTLMFAENHFEKDGVLRVFDVFIEGREVVSDLNIYEAAGGQNRPYKRTLEVTVSDRSMTIFFRADLNNAQINAIKIDPVY